VALWPARDQLLFAVIAEKQLFMSAQQEKNQSLEPQHIVVLPDLTPERQREADAAYETATRRMRVPVVLNFPVAIAQVPYLLVTRREWRPQGMLIEAWRALSWPLVGLLFWCLAGRGLEALLASLKFAVQPRMNWIEVTWAVVLLIVGIATLIGMVTSTPDDRRDKDFMALIYGGLLWGVLAGLTITARFRQWKIHKGKLAGSAC
jgi:hypothetical protein